MNVTGTVCVNKDYEGIKFCKSKPCNFRSLIVFRKQNTIHFGFDCNPGSGNMVADGRGKDALHRAMQPALLLSQLLRATSLLIKEKLTHSEEMNTPLIRLHVHLFEPVQKETIESSMLSSLAGKGKRSTHH